MSGAGLFNLPQKRIIESLLTGDKTLPELAADLGLSKPGTSKYLKNLEALHLIKGTYERNFDGRTIRYHLQPFHLVFSINPQARTVLSFQADETLDIDFFSLGFIPQKDLRDEVKIYLKQLQKISLPRLTVVLYGSVAQGTANRKSDIDLLLIAERWTKKEQRSIQEVFADAAEQTMHPVKPLFLSYSEYETLDPALKKEINDYGVILFEKGKSWEKIQQQLRRYKSITS
jgi:predicted nucleotidyltransferase